MSDTKMVDLIYPKTRAVIGLGNVGPRFDLTPHNIGLPRSMRWRPRPVFNSKRAR